jgi:hypothetical protein
MDIAEVESRVGVRFPARHRAALLDREDPIHAACDFLVIESPYELLRLVDVNAFLHSPDTVNRWPAFLVAFASNGCGDHFAYDLRSRDLPVIYMDPDLTADENLVADDKLQFATFDQWYDWQLGKRLR